MSLPTCAFLAVAGLLNAQVSCVGVDVRDVATRHYYNPFDGLLLDRNPYPYDLVDDAETLVSYLADQGRAQLEKDRGKLTSVRVMAAEPGVLSILAVLTAPHHGCAYYRARFLSSSPAFEDLKPVQLSDPRLFISLKDLTLSLRSGDGQVAMVNPVGAGGFQDDTCQALMTPVMRPEVTRTPGSAWLAKNRYRGGARGSGYMIPSRVHPEYYEGLPFVRLRRFDQPVDEFGVHGPISRGGTFALPPGIRGEAWIALKQIRDGLSRKPEALLETLSAKGLIEDENRLVRGRISNGCIRLRARDIRELYGTLADLPLGAPVTISFASDPDGSFHPFPWENTRFTIATAEKDEEGLTIMFTGQTGSRGRPRPEGLPFPSEVSITAQERAAARSLRAVSSKRPADFQRLLGKDPQAAAAFKKAVQTPVAAAPAAAAAATADL
jgi:hypothetical protein